MTTTIWVIFLCASSAGTCRPFDARAGMFGPFPTRTECEARIDDALKGYYKAPNRSDYAYVKCFGKPVSVWSE